jgi:hypothetical protein
VNYWKVILATVLIFGAGVFTGGLLVNFVEHSHPKSLRHPSAGSGSHPGTNNAVPPHWAEIPPPRLAEKLGRQFVQQLNDTLQLTPEQRERIGKLIVEGQERNRQIWTNVAPKMRAVMQEVNQQIRAELSPEQLKAFEEMLKHPAHRPLPATNPPPVALPPPLTNAPGV